MRGSGEDRAQGTATLLSEVVAGIGRLVRGELALARAEAADSLKAAGAGVIRIIVAAVLALVGLNVLAGAAVAALATTGMGPVWAALLVGLALCGVAALLLATGRAALQLKGLWPDRAVRGLRRDVAAVRAGLQEEGVKNVRRNA